MYSSLQRFNSISTYAVTVMAFVAGLIFLTQFWLDKPSSVVYNDCKVLSLHKLTLLENTQNEQASFFFDIDLDFNEYWHWNTKQLYIYLTANYVTKEGRKSSVVVWDNILRRFEGDYHVVEKGAFVKYPLIDRGRNLRGNNVTFTVGWDVAPYDGRMHKHVHEKSFSIVLPKQYSKLSRMEKESWQSYWHEFIH